MQNSNPKENTDKYLVNQSNSLIEADYSNTNLPAKTMKIGRLIISKINPNDEDFRITKISNSAIRQYLGYKNGTAYNRFNADLDDICKRLNEQVIRVRTEKGNILNAFFISSWEIDYNNDETIFEISGRLKEYLLKLKENYTTYQLQNIPKLNSSYSIRIYELLSQYRKIGKRKFSIEDLKKKIGCNYKLYGHFKSKALNKAYKELALYTDIKFEFEELKTGRKVTSIIFYIYPNDPKINENQTSLDFLDDAIFAEVKEEASNEVKARLHKYGISKANIKKFTSIGFSIISNENARKNAERRCKTIETYYIEKITLLEQSKTTDKNPAGFLIKALKEDWKSPTLFAKQKEEKRKSTKFQRNKQKIILEKKIENLKKKSEILSNKALQPLINDADIFKIAYDYGMKKLGNFGRKYIKNEQSPKEHYQLSPFLSSQIHIYLREMYPDNFKEYFALQNEIEKIENEIKQIPK